MEQPSAFTLTRSALSLAGISLLSVLPTLAQVTPGGTLGDKAIFVEAGGGEALGRSTAHDTLGPVLVNEFDTEVVADPTYDLNPSGANAAEIALSAGRHLLMYNTRINDTGGANRHEIQSGLTLAGSALSIGRAQGYTRRAGGADEAVLSGGAIITVAADNDILTLETRRSDNNAATQVDPIRAPGLTTMQLLKLDDTWDFLSLERATNQAGVNTTTFVNVAYDTNLSAGTLGTAFSVAGADITLNEGGLYVVFANTSVQKGNTNNRTQFRQRLTLDGTPVDGSTTTTYARGNEDTDNGVAAIGMIVKATAGQVLNVQINKETGDNGTIQGGETAVSIVKLPGTAAYISLVDTTNQEVNDDPGPDPVTFATQVDATSSTFSHTAGTSAVTVNEASDYLFFGSIFTLADVTNDNEDRVVPLHGWQIDGTGGPIVQGRGAQYNRDTPGARTSGSWGGAIIPLSAAQTVEMTTQRLGNLDQGLGSATSLQGLSISSLLPSNDPTIGSNAPLFVTVNTTGTLTTSVLNTIDADDAPAAVTYTVDSAPTLGALKNGATTLGVGGTFTQADIDSGAVTFEAGAATGTGGFDFTVADDSGSGNTASGTFVVGIGVATILADDVAPTDEDTPFNAPAPGVLFNDMGTDLSVTAFDATSAQGATVTVASDGDTTYDPTAAAALQALDDGESVVDTFTYTVTDFSSTQTVANVDITVTGANDAPVAIDDATSGNGRTTSTLNILANDSDVDTSDTINVVSINGNPVGLAGLTILSSEEATVTINPDGSFSYDPSTSGDIGALATGAVLQDTITYEISDGDVTVSATITITSVGTPGVSNDLGLVVANATTNINILGNDELLGAAGTPTAGAVTDLDAATAGNTNAAWINTGAAAAVDEVMESAGTGSVLVTSLTGAPIGVTAAYDLSGVGSGATINSVDTLPNIYGSNISTTDASIEMVFRSDDVTGNEPLWGTGGNGVGSSLVLIEGDLIFTVCQAAIVMQASGPLPGTDFVHVVATIDLAADTLELYINNVLVDSGTAIDITNAGAAADITDWSGTETEGIGRASGTTGGDTATAPFLGSFGTVDIPDFNDALERFDGEIALLRVYSGAVLDATTRTANYEAIFGAASAPVVGDIVDLAGETSLVPGTTVVTLPSGATVMLESDGTLTYDPNGAFDHIATGSEGVDTFTYRLGGSDPSTATVVVRVAGSNSDPEISIAADQSNVTEGSTAGFTVSAAGAVASTVTVNLSYSGTATGGSDFTSQASIDITTGNTTADLDLATIADSLFENGSETITVTIDSISGPASLGTTLSAGTILDDGDSAPVFTLAGGGSVTEGSAAAFTVNASVASSQAITIDLAYSGTASSDDFATLGQATFPAMSSTTPLALLTYNDGIADPGETIIATITNPTLGTIGSPDSATATISDGAGASVFFADFEGVNPLDTPGGTLLNGDAPSAANLGTAVGSWANVLDDAVPGGGAPPGLIPELNDARGDGNDTMLRQDRPSTTADGMLCAVFDGAIDISGSNSGTISFDIGQLRTLSTDKNSSIIGLDPAGNKSFELLVNGDNAGPFGRSLFHVDSVGTLTQIAPFNSLPNTQDAGNSGNNESGHTNIRLGLTSTGYTVALDTPAIDGTADIVTELLDYAGGATLVTKLVFQIAGSTNIDLNGGLLLDNVSAVGTRLSTQEAWRQIYYGSPANSGPGADGATAANSLTNLENFALGLDPTTGAGVLDVDAATGTILSLGPPTIWVDPADGRIYQRRTRRTDLAALGIDAEDEFSRDLTAFETSVVMPTVIATGSGGGVAIEAVQTEFPFALPISGGKGRYGRVSVTINP